MIRHRAFQAAGIALCSCAIVAGTVFASPSAQTPPAAYAPAQPQTPPPLVYGDLLHLVFTATSGLHGSFVSPSDGEALSVMAAQVTVETVNGAGVEMRVNGETVSYKRLGKRVVDTKTGKTQYVFYGLNLQPGPNVLEATILGADGLRGDTFQETIFGPGFPTQVHAKINGALIADGKTPAYLQISATDAWGHPALPGAKLRVTLKGGARFASTQQPASAESPSPQVSASPGDQAAEGQRYEAPLSEGAFVSLPVVPGVVPGPLEVDVDASGIEAHEHFYIDPYLRKPFVAGLISAGAGSIPGSADGDGNEADDGRARKARVAVFASGKAARDTLLTAAYESQNRLAPLSSNGAFAQNPAERPYVTYGDASRVVSDLKSNDHLFARVDKGRSNAMWGQFDATTGDADAGSYHQLLSGAKVELNAKNDRTRLVAFTAHNDVAYVSQTFPVTGLSALMQNLRPDIVVGSDDVQLVALDRRTGAVVSSTMLVRNVDYTIDYATGVIRFIEIPLPYDEHFNPQAIVLQYQYQGAATDSRTTGGNLRFNFGADGGTSAQFGYVNDVTGEGAYALASQAVTRKWAGGEWSLSHASNAGTYPNAAANGRVSGSGDAVSFRLHSHDGFDDVDLAFADTTPGFYNPFGGLSTPGLLTYRAGFSRTLPRRSTFTAAFDGQANRGTGSDERQQNATVSFGTALSEKLTLLLGFVEHRQTAAGVAGTGATPAEQPGFASLTTSQLQTGVQYHPSKHAAFSVQHVATLSGSDYGSTQPSQTGLQFDYDLGTRGKFYVRELMSSQPVATFATATAPLTAGSGFTRSLQFGMERPLTAAMTVSSDYVINHTGDATDVYTALGVQEKFRLSPSTAGNLFYQNANDAGPSRAGFHVFGADLAYSKPNAVRASLSYQTRTGSNGGSTFSGGVGGRLSQNASVMGTFQRAFGNGQTGIDERLSFAYRPQENDRFVSLLGYRRTNATAGIFGGSAIADVVSFEEVWRPSGELEIGSRFAYKLNGDGFYVAHTSMRALRARQMLGKRFDAGAELREFDVPGTYGGHTTDFAVETGYQLGNSTRVAAGYNFSGGTDPTLTGHPQRKGLFLQVTTLVDRFFGWGKN